MHVVLGTGPVGRSVIKELRRQGEQIRVVNYSGKQPFDDVPVVKADLMDLNQATAAIAGATVVYQCTKPPYHQWEEKFEHLQENVIAAAMAAGAKLVATENVYMYGKVDGEMHEGLPYRAKTKKGKVRARLSERLLELHRLGKLQSVLGRASDFFGPGVTESSAGERLFQPLVAGKPASVLGDPSRMHTFTFVEDFGKALVTLGQSEDAYGEAWHVPNAETVTVKKFIEISAQLAGVKARIKPMGKMMLRVGGLFIPAAKESVEMFYEFEEDFIVSSRKFANRFMQQATPLEKSLAATVQWYQAR